MEKHVAYAETFFKKGSSISDFLLNIKQTRSTSTYRNYLKTLKMLFRDYLKQPELIQDYKFPKKQYVPKIIPSKEQLGLFYNNLLNKDKSIFLALATSGLRISELLNCEIDKANRMLIPKSHNGSTKQCWISFYNNEVDFIEPLNVKPCVVAHAFKKVERKIGIKTLRSIFACELSRAGVQYRYIDALGACLEVFWQGIAHIIPPKP